MKNSILPVSTESDITDDPLYKLICNGAKKLIVFAVDAKFDAMLQQHAERYLNHGCYAVVRND